MNKEDPRKSQSPSLLQVVASVLAAGFGVQSEKNRERDFTSGSAKAYVVAGVIGTLLFILAIYGIVKLVLNLAG